jgi:hypothetical protein
MAPTSDPLILIGFTGYLRSGKDTAGQFLREEAGSFHHASFAAKLKAFLYAVNPVIPRNPMGYGHYRLRELVDAYGWEKVKDDFPEVRQLLQRTGTDAGRRVLGENVWVDAVMADLPDTDVVFTDCRFPNEAQAIKDAGGYLVRVTRPGFEPGPDAHESETALDGYPHDFEIKNTGTLEDLRDTVGRVYETFRARHELGLVRPETATQAS